MTEVFSFINRVVFAVFHVYPSYHFSSFIGFVETPNDAVSVVWILVVLVLIFGQTTSLGLFLSVHEDKKLGDIYFCATFRKLLLQL